MKLFDSSLDAPNVLRPIEKCFRYTGAQKAYPVETIHNKCEHNINLKYHIIFGIS